MKDYHFDVDTQTYYFRDDGKIVEVMNIERIWRNRGTLEEFGVQATNTKKTLWQYIKAFIKGATP